MEGESSPSLKLKIRLSSPLPESGKVVPKANAGPSQGKVNLSVLTFPRLPDYPQLRKAASAANHELWERWSDSEGNAVVRDLAQLSRDLSSLGKQLGTLLHRLEEWRLQEPLPPRGREDSDSEESGLRDGGDPTDPSFQREGSSSDDDLDLLDPPDSLDPDGDPDSRPKGGSRRGAPTGPTGMWKPRDRPSASQGPRGSRGRPRFRGGRASGAARERKRRNPDDSSGEEVALPRRGKNSFWADMEPFFSLSPEDEKILNPSGLDPDDPAFVIPPLGKLGPTKPDWESDSDSDSFRPPSKQLRSHESQAVPDLSNRPIGCGDLTQRILAALLEEALLPPPEQWDGPDDPLPLSAPPTYDYSHAAMHSLELRLRWELRALGLWEEGEGEGGVGEGEEDEVTGRLREEQQSLKRLLALLHPRLLALRPAFAAALQADEGVKKDRLANVTLEKTFLKLMRKKRRKSGA